MDLFVVADVLQLATEGVFRPAQVDPFVILTTLPLERIIRSRMRLPGTGVFRCYGCV
jgi:hypothetical protein